MRYADSNHLLLIQGLLSAFLPLALCADAINNNNNSTLSVSKTSNSLSSSIRLSSLSSIVLSTSSQLSSSEESFSEESSTSASSSSFASSSDLSSLYSSSEILSSSSEIFSSSSEYSSTHSSTSHTSSFYSETSSEFFSVESSSTTFTPTSSSESSQSTNKSVHESTLTTVVNGSTYISDVYVTVSATPKANNTSGKHSGLSKKNRNIVIGCLVGIGVPLILICLLVFYMFCIQSKKTDFIDSDGKVVTAYSANKLTSWWYDILGKDASEKYETNSPLGTSSSDLDQHINDNTSINDFDFDAIVNRHNITNHGSIDRNGSLMTHNVASNNITRKTTLLNQGNKSVSNNSNNVLINEEYITNNDNHNAINARNF